MTRTETLAVRLPAGLLALVEEHARQSGSTYSRTAEGALTAHMCSTERLEAREIVMGAAVDDLRADSQQARRRVKGARLTPDLLTKLQRTADDETRTMTAVLIEALVRHCIGGPREITRALNEAAGAAA